MKVLEQYFLEQLNLFTKKCQNGKMHEHTYVHYATTPTRKIDCFVK